MKRIGAPKTHDHSIQRETAGSRSKGSWATSGSRRAAAGNAAHRVVRLLHLLPFSGLYVSARHGHLGWPMDGLACPEIHDDRLRAVCDRRHSDIAYRADDGHKMLAG